MLDGKNYPVGSAVYTFVDNEGVNTHVDSELLRQWCAAHTSELEVRLTPVASDIARSFLTDNVVDIDHLKRVMRMKTLDPLIYGHTGDFTNGNPDVLLIDGHHRYFCAWLCKVAWMPAYILSPEQWHPFQIEGLPSQTHEQLRRAPVKNRRPA